MKKIIYQCNRQPDHFTVHALFNSVTDNFYANLVTNSHSLKRPYKTWFSDRLINLIVEDDVHLNLQSYTFNHHGEKILLKMVSIEDYVSEYHYNAGDFVVVEGVISYCISVSSDVHGRKMMANPSKTSKKICPIDLHGNFVTHKFKDGRSAREITLDYLHTNTGLLFNTAQIDQRSEIRFEPLNYKSFKKPDGQDVYSQTNAQSIDFHNLFYFHATALVQNPETVNGLSVSSIGRRRSYGFGNINISAL